MQDLKEESVKARITLKFLWEYLRFVRRYPKHPEALEPYLNSLRTRGAPEANVATLRPLLILGRETVNDRAAQFRMDRYLAAGMGAVDLVLLPVVLPIGVPDHPLFLATVFLAVSLVFVAVSFFVSFIKRDVGLTGYGKVHGTVIFLAQASGVAALTGTFWHSSPFVGILFLALVVPAYLLCVSYAVLAKMAVGLIRLQSAVNEPAADASTTTREGAAEHA
jgi:hypothetical protein